jgi:hypothetical protein
MIPLLREYLLENWSQLFFDDLQPGKLIFLLQGTGVSKLCCYIFYGDEVTPRWIAKMARTPRENWVLDREYELIQLLRREGSDFVRTTIPEPLLTTCIAGHFVAIESYFCGRPMTVFPVEAGIHQDGKSFGYLDQSVDWLIQSQRETIFQNRCLTEQEISFFLLSPIRQLKSTAHLMDEEEAYLNELMGSLVELAKKPLPLVFSHGDLRPGNILINGNELLIIDWEFGAPVSLPLMDLFSLLARTYARCKDLEEIDGYLEEYLDAFEAVFFRDGQFAKISQKCIAHISKAFEIDVEWLEGLFALFLVNEANKYYAFLNRCANRGYVYLLSSKSGRLNGSYLDQLARQKYVWLIGHLVKHRDQLIFR